MQIVIDIQEERYRDIQRIAEVQIESARFQTAEQIIANGTPTRGSYEQGYNDAKREIALSGEYERAYQRGFDDGRKSEWTAVADKESEEC